MKRKKPILAGECTTQGEAHFLEKFGIESFGDYQPLFLAVVSSYSGELAESFGLFERRGGLYEVNGTECSVWDFTGQFKPEPTLPAALLRRIVSGNLGKSNFDGSDLYRKTLRDFIETHFDVSVNQFTALQKLEIASETPWTGWLPKAGQAELCSALSQIDPEGMAAVFGVDSELPGKVWSFGLGEATAFLTISDDAKADLLIYWDGMEDNMEYMGPLRYQEALTLVADIQACLDLGENLIESAAGSLTP